MRRMTRLSLWSLMLIFCVLMTACGKKEASGYNQYVDSFTSGQVSRTQSVVLVLSQDIAEDRLSKLDAADIMELSPSAKGKYAFADAHTLVFTPSEGLERNAEYTVTTDIAELFPEVEDSERTFTFSIKTRPSYFQGYFDAFEEKEDNVYNITFSIITSDSEDAEYVEKRVRTSNGTPTWEHLGDGIRHTLKVEVAAKNESQTLEVTASDDMGDNRTLATCEVPSTTEMKVISVRCRQEDQYYVEVTFSKRLDEKQNMMGLASIVGNESKAVDVDGNTIRLYPDANTRGDATVWLSGDIKSATGVSLGADQQLAVSLDVAKPAVKFTTNRVIVPLSDNVAIPFSAIYLRGVRVKIIKIFANNVGSLMAVDNLDYQGGDMTRFGRPVAVKTIYFDEATDFTRWHTYSLDLGSLIKAEPGALYRVRLEVVSSLSAWPSADFAQKTKSEIEAEDNLIFNQMIAKFDSGDGWFYENDIDWSKYIWNERDDPSKATYYMGKGDGRNVFATNIGLSAFMGDGYETEVVAMDLPSAKPMEGVKLNVFNFQNQIVGTATTDADGKATISPDIVNGRPFYVKATKDNDHSYLRMMNGESLSTSTFDVAGAEAQTNGLKGFIYGERGVWRPGDTLHIGFMLKDADGKLPENHPVVLEVSNTLGQLISRQVRKEGQMGLYAFNVPTDADAVTGSWSAKVSVGGATFEKRLRIETIKPNRLKINMDVPEVIRPGGQSLSMHTEWLSGTKVGGLRYETEVAMAPTTTKFDNWKGFVFDDATREFGISNMSLGGGVTDDGGDAVIGFTPRVKVGAPGMLRAAITTRVYEPSGDFSTDSRFTKVSPYDNYVGIKTPQAGRSQLATGESHTFNVAAVDYNGKGLHGESVSVDVYKTEYYWWWSATNELANFRSDNYRRPVKQFNLTTDASGKATFSLNFPDCDWGTYLICVTDMSSGHSASTLAYFDWPTIGDRSADGSGASTILSVKFDKEEYKVGDQMTLTFPSANGAQGIVSLCRGGKPLSTKMVACTGEQTSVKIDVTNDMMPNVYAYVSMVQPYNQTANDAPMRLYGIAQATVTSTDSHLSPVITSKDDIRPMAKATVTVSEQKGRPMAYTLAIVDEGLLDLTHFKTPDAWETFYAREALGVNLWDVYNIVAGAYGGRIEQMFSIGGDDALLNNSPKAIVNRFTPIVKFVGPFTLKKGEKKSHEIDVPSYVGRVRMMVVATDGSAYGSAEKSVKVTKPLMLYGTMPRQIGVGDKASVSATVMASQALGNVDVKITAANGVKVVGESTKSVNLDGEGEKTVTFNVEAGDVAGEATVSIVATSKSEKSDYTTRLKVRHEGQIVSTTSGATIQPGKEWSADVAAKQGSLEDAIVELSSVKPLNIAPRVAELIRYPHGCAEQTTSKALAQLYLDDFTDLSKEQKSTIEANIKSALNKLYKHVVSDGGIGYWDGSSFSNYWCSAYVYIFFSEAESRGYFVQSSVKKSLANYLSKNLNVKTPVSAGLALYALALDKKANLGSMNRVRESLVAPSSEVYNFLAAAYALAGHKSEAESLLQKGGSGDDISRLIAQTAVDDANAAQTAESLRKMLVSDEWMSTYETGRSLMAWSRYAKKTLTSSKIEATVSADGKKLAAVESEKSSWQGGIDPSKAKKLNVKNDGDGLIYASLTTMAQVGQQVVEPVSNGLNITVVAKSTKGDVLTLDNVKAGDTYSVKFIIRNTSGRDLENIAVTHALPAGVEILRAVKGENCSYMDVRDDRILFYANSLPVGSYLVLDATLSATYAGTYYRPATTAEAMYDNKIYGCTSSGQMVIE